MRIVASPDGLIDRYDRALWLTPPFDRAFIKELPPTSEGIQFTLPKNKAHFTLPENRMHFRAPQNRLHFTIKGAN